MKTIQAHRVEATLTETGTLTLEHLPFQAGDIVEVIVLPSIASSATNSDVNERYPLRGMAIRYDQPFASVAEDEWNTLQ